MSTLRQFHLHIVVLKLRPVLTVQWTYLRVLNLVPSIPGTSTRYLCQYKYKVEDYKEAGICLFILDLCKFWTLNSCKNTTQRKMQAILVTLDKSLTGIQHDALLEARRWKEREREEGWGSCWKCVHPNCVKFASCISSIKRCMKSNNMLMLKVTMK